jgi:hypothetical protein
MIIVSLRFEIEPKDYKAFYYYAAWSNSKKKKERLYGILKQVAISVVFLGVLFYSGGIRYFNKYTILLLALMLATSLLSIFTTKSSLDKQVEEFIENPENENIFTETFINFTETEINIKNKFEEKKIVWNAFCKKSETDDYYFLFYNSVQAEIIPKKAFINNVDKITFDALLSRNLSIEAQLKEAIQIGDK